ncbi:fatty acid desaturase family protein [Aquabacterium sp.]|uniref:fatty acid desaturase family protein n=1 Tax=Aquabacterium sp. TaxID=1872578 RepID=UPI002C448862|nr:fatty acid desaturase [Aquabacterium sp.]HSW03794.1 fatty acid desaturase [Aquabacterium sp.]
MEALPEPRQRASFNTHTFFFGRYYLLNVLGYGLATIAVLRWNHLFETTSPWWLFGLVPLFLTRFRYIIAGAAVLILLTLWHYRMEMSWGLAILCIAAIYLGHLSAVFIHNAAHLNFRPLWLNGVIGEACALQQLSAGLVVWRFFHAHHHAFPDDPERDPHPPKGYTFWQFIDVARLLIARRLEGLYLKNWGDTAETRKRWKQQNLLLLLSRFAKTLFVFSLLGPKYFALAFVPSYISNVLCLAAFNYFTHQEQPEGTVEARNLRGSPYFDFCNRFLFGVYYHKNHHRNPRAFNPMSVDADPRVA